VSRDLRNTPERIQGRACGLPYRLRKIREEKWAPFPGSKASGPSGKNENPGGEPSWGQTDLLVWREDRTLVGSEPRKGENRRIRREGICEQNGLLGGAQQDVLRNLSHAQRDHMLKTKRERDEKFAESDWRKVGRRVLFPNKITKESWREN